MKKRIRTNGIVIFIAVFVLAIFPAYCLRQDNSPFSYFIDVVGFACIILGQLLRVVSRGYKAEHSGQGTYLVQGGPYAMVRNPMYLGILLIGCGVVLLLFHLWVFCIFLIFFVSRYISLIFQEEKILLKNFGERYQHYMKCVPRLMPRFSFFVRHELRAYLSLKREWFRRELPSIIAVIVVVFGIKLKLSFEERGWQEMGVQLFFFMIILFLYGAFVVFLMRNRKQRNA